MGEVQETPTAKGRLRAHAFEGCRSSYSIDAREQQEEPLVSIRSCARGKATRATSSRPAGGA